MANFTLYSTSSSVTGTALSIAAYYPAVIGNLPIEYW